jgi:hypothetical protein
MLVVVLDTCITLPPEFAMIVRYLNIGEPLDVNDKYIAEPRPLPETA